MSQKLTSIAHDRDVIGLTYVYPVMSRRAGGLSIGVNFNPNNACNWRCSYCQVPHLTKGSAPKMDFELLEQELLLFIEDVLEGDFYQRFNVPEEQRVIKDIALSGNGEPTSLKNFERAVNLVADCAKSTNIFPQAKFILITNGSFMHRKDVQQGLKVLNKYRGEIWFKMDSVTVSGLFAINHTRFSPQSQLSGLVTAANLCQTKLQTCLVNDHGQGLLASEKDAYLRVMNIVKTHQLVKEIMLYTLERPALQPEAPYLEKMPFETMENFADVLRTMGFQVSVH